MKSTPLIISGSMIRAYMEGRKCVTRRTKGLDLFNIPSKDGLYGGPDDWVYCLWFNHNKKRSDESRPYTHHVFLHKKTELAYSIKFPFGGAGDELYFRENWGTYQQWDHLSPKQVERHSLAKRIIRYQVEGEHKYIKKWRPSIHLPKSLCRFEHVPIVSVRPERLLPMTSVDVLEEGFNTSTDFIEFWNEKNEHKGLGTEVNPWVWRIEFEPFQSSSNP